MTPGTAPPRPEHVEPVLEGDVRSRHPLGIQGKIVWVVALCWSLFQLWYASPLPFILEFGVFNTTEARSIHLSFALFLAFTAYPAFRSSPRERIPLLDWVFAILGVMSASYLYFFYEGLATRAGSPPLIVAAGQSSTFVAPMPVAVLDQPDLAGVHSAAGEPCSVDRKSVRGPFCQPLSCAAIRH